MEPYTWSSPHGKNVLMNYIEEKFAMRFIKDMHGAYILTDIHAAMHHLLQLQPEHLTFLQGSRLPDLDQVQCALQESDSCYKLLPGPASEGWYMRHTKLHIIVTQLNSTTWSQDDNDTFWETDYGKNCAKNLIIQTFKECASGLNTIELHLRVHEKLWNKPIARDDEHNPSIITREGTEDFFYNMPEGMFIQNGMRDGLTRWVLNRT